MRKRAVCWMALSLWLLAGCGGPAGGGEIALPDAGAIAQVTITDGKTEVVSRDAALISRMLAALGQAVRTGEASVQDVPEGAWVRLDFGFRSGGESRLFLCRRGGAVLLEQPFQGVFRTGGAVLGLLKEAGGWT